MSEIKIIVNGAAGNMGQEVIRAVTAESGLKLVGAVDICHHAEDKTKLANLEEHGVKISTQLEELLTAAPADVVIDFTVPTAVMNNISTILAHKVRPVVGTTGLTEADLPKIKKWVESAGVGCLVAPNFAIGAVLMMVLAARAMPYMQSVEIIEMHHNQKIDFPSGTAIKTAEMIDAKRSEQKKNPERQELEKIPSARGASYKGINIHSVRLPGLVAHQTVILGDEGQTLTIRHDSLNRKSFMPGVILAVQKVMELDQLVYGLENILEL